MAKPKLSSKQLSTVAVLETFLPKFDQIHRLIEEMSSLRADITQQRRLTRTLDEMKAAAQAVGESALADSLGTMGMISRRTGGLQTRIRGLREGFVSLKVNFEGAMKAASTPEKKEGELDEAEAEL